MTTANFQERNLGTALSGKKIRPVGRIGFRRLVSSVGRAPVCCAGGRWFVPQTEPTLRVLK